MTGNRRDIVRLSITLQYVEPRVARLMDVPLDTYLDNLHLYIQAAMGWGNDHAWGFDARRYGQGAHRGPEEWDEQLDETLLDVIAFLKGKREFTYVYDYGDRWEHRIRIGTIQPARDDRRYPYLVSGTGHCPLEDSGGVWATVSSCARSRKPRFQRRIRFSEDPLQAAGRDDLQTHHPTDHHGRCLEREGRNAGLAGP